MAFKCVSVFYVQKIQLNDIVKVQLSPTSVTRDNTKHVFELHTTETQFYVGEYSSEKDRQSGGSGGGGGGAGGAEENGRGVECAQRMAKAIRQAWLPVTSEANDSTANGRMLIDEADETLIFRIAANSQHISC